MPVAGAPPPVPTVVPAAPRGPLGQTPKLPPTSPAGKPARDNSALAWFAGNRPLARPCVEPDPSDTGTRIFAESAEWRASWSRASYIDDVASGRENSQQIFTENGARIRLAGPNFI